MLTGMWVGIPENFLQTEEDMRFRLEEVKEAGINLVNLQYEPELNKKMLCLCEEIGLKASLKDPRFNGVYAQEDGWRETVREITADYMNYPALLEYRLKDEPQDSDFDRLAEITAEFRKNDPDHGVYINLLPLLALGNTENYVKHVASFLSKVKPRILSYDYYSLLKREVPELDMYPEAVISKENREANGWEGKIFEKYNRETFYDNIETVRRLASEAGIPWMIIVMLTEHWQYRYLNEAEIRWEVFQSLVYGPERISFFTYWNPGKTGESWSYHHAMIECDGTRDAHYDMVRNVNKDAQAVRAVLDGAESLGVYHVGPETDKVTFFDDPVCGIDNIDAESVSVGFFEKDGRNFALIANKDMEESQTITVETTKRLLMLDRDSGDWEPLPSVCGVAFAEIGAGDGILVEIIY